MKWDIINMASSSARRTESPRSRVGSCPERRSEHALDKNARQVARSAMSEIGIVSLGASSGASASMQVLKLSTKEVMPMLHVSENGQTVASGLNRNTR